MPLKKWLSKAVRFVLDVDAEVDAICAVIMDFVSSFDVNLSRDQ